MRCASITSTALTLRAAATQLYAAGGADHLVAIFTNAAETTSAGNAVCALRLVLTDSDWRADLEACLNTDAALSGLLALAAGELQPRGHGKLHATAATHVLQRVMDACGERARPLCAPGVLSGGAAALLVALFASGSGRDGGDSADVRAGMLLDTLLESEDGAARAALARCRHTLASCALDVLAQRSDSRSIGAGLLLHRIMTTSESASWLAEALHGPLLPQLTRLCAQLAPEDMAAMSALAGLATNPRVAALIKTLLQGNPGALSTLVIMQASVIQPVVYVLRRAVALQPGAVRDLQAAQQKRQLKLARQEEDAEVNCVTDDALPAALAARPLLRASFAAGLTERMRTALARANAVECHENAVASLTSIRLNEWRMVFITGFQATVVHDCPTAPFAYTTGLNYLLRGPEVLVLGDLPDVSADMRTRLTGHLCWHAANCVLDAASELDAPPGAPAELVHGKQLSERDVQLIPWLFKQLERRVPPAVAAAAGGITWRFVSLHQQVIDGILEGGNHGGDNDPLEQHIAGSLFGRTRASFYANVACATMEDLATCPTLVCTMGASLSGEAGAAVLQALRSLSGDPAVPQAHGGVCPCVTCQMRRDCGAVCASDACAARHSPHLLGVLKKCGRCKRVSYCSVQCQRADWRRHKGECAPAAAEDDSSSKNAQ